MMPEKTDLSRQAITGRYLVQFRRPGREDFETDLGFGDDQLGLARYHVHLVLDTLESVAEGRVWDTELRRCVYHHASSQDTAPVKDEGADMSYQGIGSPEDPLNLRRTEGYDPSVQSGMVGGPGPTTTRRLERGRPWAT